MSTLALGERCGLLAMSYMTTTFTTTFMYGQYRTALCTTYISHVTHTYVHTYICTYVSKFTTCDLESEQQ